jgi:hypothetical protein
VILDISISVSNLYPLGSRLDFLIHLETEMQSQITLPLFYHFLSIGLGSNVMRQLDALIGAPMIFAVDRVDHVQSSRRSLSTLSEAC